MYIRFNNVVVNDFSERNGSNPKKPRKQFPVNHYLCNQIKTCKMRQGDYISRKTVNTGNFFRWVCMKIGVKCPGFCFVYKFTNNP